MSAATSYDNFQPIVNWDDVTPYAGQIVAVSSNHYRFAKTFFEENDPHASAFTFSDIPYSFAHVTRVPITYFEGGIGYHLNTLLKVNAVQSASIINKDTLAENGLSLALRVATPDELKRIREAISSSNAVFSDAFCHSAKTDAKHILDSIV